MIDPIRLFDEDLHRVMTPVVRSEGQDRRRVLVVDDSLSVRKYVSTLLSDKDLIVHTAPNGQEALRILEKTPVDLIITDLEMPVMHGYELINRIRSSETFRDLPIVVLTSRSTEKHMEKAFEMGSDDYLVKPFDEDSLMSVVNRHLPEELRAGA
jgi:chemosensory pili system protein ChpA (sensor histidine kinase/response regulator)